MTSHSPGRRISGFPESRTIRSPIQFPFANPAISDFSAREIMSTLLEKLLKRAFF
jgi:hypothetical protein